jgi:hypothetical protein
MAVAPQAAGRGPCQVPRSPRRGPPSRNPAIGRAPEVHLHLHGVSAEDIAAIVNRQTGPGRGPLTWAPTLDASESMVSVTVSVARAFVAAMMRCAWTLSWWALFSIVRPGSQP